MLHNIAMGLYAVDCLMMASFSLVYLLRPRVMPYHLQAMDCEWDEIPGRTQLVLLALMRAAGSAYLGLAIAMGFLIAAGLRQPASWINWALVAMGLGLLAPLTAVVVKVRRSTGARSPIASCVVAIVVLLIGFGCEWWALGR